LHLANPLDQLGIPRHPLKQTLMATAIKLRISSPSVIVLQIGPATLLRSAGIRTRIAARPVRGDLVATNHAFRTLTPGALAPAALGE